MKIKAQRSHHAADSTRANMPVTSKEVGTHYSCLGNRRDAYTLSPASPDSWCWTLLLFLLFLPSPGWWSQTPQLVQQPEKCYSPLSPHFLSHDSWRAPAGLNTFITVFSTLASVWCHTERLHPSEVQTCCLHGPTNQKKVVFERGAVWDKEGLFWTVTDAKPLQQSVRIMIVIIITCVSSSEHEELDHRKQSDPKPSNCQPAHRAALSVFSSSWFLMNCIYANDKKIKLLESHIQTSPPASPSIRTPYPADHWRRRDPFVFRHISIIAIHKALKSPKKPSDSLSQLTLLLSLLFIFLIWVSRIISSLKSGKQPLTSQIWTSAVWIQTLCVDLTYQDRWRAWVISISDGNKGQWTASTLLCLLSCC